MALVVYFLFFWYGGVGVMGRSIKEGSTKYESWSGWLAPTLQRGQYGVYQMYIGEPP